MQYGVAEAEGADGFDWAPLAAHAPGKEPEEVAQVGCDF